MTAAPEISFTVEGKPAPQGSKDVYRGRVVESSPAVKPWREAVALAALRAMGGRWDAQYYDGPVGVEITFLVARAKSHYRKGRNSHLLYEWAPPHPHVRPDLDKYVRATLDALTAACAIRDDARVTDLHAVKRYCRRDQAPGALITIREIWETEP